MWVFAKMNGRLKRIVAMLILAAIFANIATMMSGCISYARGEYPPETGKKWTCADPEIVLDCRNEQYQDQQCWVIKNDVKINVIMSYRGTLFWIWLPGNPTEDKIMVRGTWKYRHGDLVFTIKEDNLFDGQYKEFVFVREETA